MEVDELIDASLRMKHAATRTAPVRMAVVGFCGHQGAEYVRAAGAIDEIEIVTLVDVDAGAGVKAEQLGLPVYGDVHTMLAQHAVDVAVVTVPHSEHVATTRALLEAGCHVLKEKPLAPSRSEAIELVQCANAAERAVLTLTQRPLRSDFRQLFRSLEKIGHPYLISYNYALDFPAPSLGWRGQADLALGGVLLDMGYHVIDIFTHLFGAPEEIHASRHYRYEESRTEKLEDLVTAQLEYPSIDLTAAITISRHAHEREEIVTVQGTEGVVRLDALRGEVSVFDRAGALVEHHEEPDAGRAIEEEMLRDLLLLLQNPARSAANMAHHIINVSVCDWIYAITAEKSDALPESATGTTGRSYT